MMKIKTREQIEDLLIANATALNLIDPQITSHILWKLSSYSPSQLAVLTDYFISYQDKKLRKKIFKYLNKIRYIEEDPITPDHIPVTNLYLPIIYKPRTVVGIQYSGKWRLVIIASKPNPSDYIDITDECYYGWLIPEEPDEEFNIDNLLQGYFHIHPHILECSNEYINCISRRGDAEWINKAIYICNQAINKLEEK